MLPIHGAWAHVPSRFMSGLDDIVRRLNEVTDEILALEDGDFANRFRLDTKRDALRAQAEVFHKRKDEGRSTEQLHAELTARRGQLEQLRDQLINRAAQASAASGTGGGGERPIGADKGGTLNHALMEGLGARSVVARIAELEQELARR